MKILLFLPNLGGGGTERAVVNLSKEFLRRGIEVKLVTLEPTVDLETDPDGVVCLGVPNRPCVSSDRCIGMGASAGWSA